MHSVTTLNIFLILLVISKYLGRDIKFINQLKGIWAINPFISLSLSINFLSLAG